MLMAVYDWYASPLGPTGTWPQSLRTAVSIMLSSRYAMWMVWGPELTFFCNDAYRPTLGVKHSWALGSALRRSLGRDLARALAAHRDRAEHGRRHLGRRPAAVPRAQRLSRGDLPHLFLQPAARRSRDDRRHALRGHRGDRARSSASAGWPRCASSRASWRAPRPSEELAAAIEQRWPEPPRPAVRAALPVRRGRPRRAGSPDDRHRAPATPPRRPRSGPTHVAAGPPPS